MFDDWIFDIFVFYEVFWDKLKVFGGDFFEVVHGLDKDFLSTILKFLVFDFDEVSGYDLWTLWDAALNDYFNELKVFLEDVDGLLFLKWRVFTAFLIHFAILIYPETVVFEGMLKGDLWGLMTVLLFFFFHEWVFLCLFGLKNRLDLKEREEDLIELIFGQIFLKDIGAYGEHQEIVDDNGVSDFDV